MRELLEPFEGQRLRFSAVVERFGSKPGYKGHDLETILFKNVRVELSGELVTDHLWFVVGKWSADLRTLHLVTFDARVTSYVKGYRGRREVYDSPLELDYRLERPSKVRVEGTVENPNQPMLS